MTLNIEPPKLYPEDNSYQGGLGQGVFFKAVPALPKIALYGYKGTVGSILGKHYDCAYKLELGDDILVASTVIWCATIKHEHTNLKTMTDDLSNFLEIMKVCDEQVQRIIFTSSYGIETTPNNTEAVNYYAAGKIAAEAFLDAWTRGGQNRSAVSIRLGSHGFNNPTDREDYMTAEQICAVYDYALTKGVGFHVINPVRRV